MIVVPLGLGTKLRRAPIVTVLLTLLWIAVYLVDRSDNVIIPKLFNAVAQTGVRDEARRLFVEYCKTRKGDRRTCERYAVLVWTGFPAKVIKAAPKKTRMPAPRDPKAMALAEADVAAATKARKELRNCGTSVKCFTYKDTIWHFLDESNRNAASLQTLPSYKSYAKAIANYRKNLKGICREQACLVPSNINVASLTAAQLRHGSFGHLFGNLLVFVLFGIYVEQRTSRTFFLLTTIIGGTIGMAVHTAIFSSADMLVLGGSANVSTVLGMFLVFFFRHRMRTWVWLPRRIYFGSTFRAPVMFIIPLIFVISDVAGGFDPGFETLNTAKVAHFAHLTGLLVGILAALVMTSLKKVPMPLLYEGEVDDLNRLAASKNPGESLALATTMIGYNPDNILAMELGCSTYLRLLRVPQTPELEPVVNEGRHFMTNHLQTFCAVSVRNGQLSAACKMLAAVPMNIPLRVVLGRLGQINALKIADYSVTKGVPGLAFRVYDFYLNRYTLSRQCEGVLETVDAVLNSLTPTPALEVIFGQFLAHHTDSQLAGRVGAWLANAREAQIKGA